MSQPLEGLIDEHIAEFLLQNPNVAPTDVETIAQAVFMSITSPEDVENFNARRTFLELLAIPNDADISEYCFLKCATRWALSPDGGFYRKDRIEPGEQQSVSREAVHADYCLEKEKMERRVREFERYGWHFLPLVCSVPELPNERRVSLILAARGFCGIPTKDKIMVGEDGRITSIEYAPVEEAVDEQVISAIRGVN